MQYITVNVAFTAVLRIPESQSGDTVTYVIYKASDGTTFASGSATFLAGNNWKVSFTPSSTDETYVLEITDSTLDRVVSEQYKATTAPVVTTTPVSGTDAASLLTAVNNAILARMNGGAVQSYTIGNRNLQYMTLAELRKFRTELQAEVNLDQPLGSTNFATFGDPS
jgi:hypothetical protein